MLTDVIIGYIFSLYRFIKRKIMGKDINDNKLKVGIITKVYPQIDSFEVRFRDKNKKVMAKMLHRCLCGVMDFYTPEGKEYYSETFKQNYIVPKKKFHVFLLN